MTTIPTRNRAWERRGLERHGSSEFVRETLARLDAGGREYGESWAGRSPLDLISEAREECADTAGWALLALQRLGEGPCDEAAASQLVGAINQAAAAHSHLEAAREFAEVPLESA